MARSVTGTVLGEALGPKLVIFKFKQKVKYRRHTGHRQHLTRVRIDEIAAAGTSKRRADGAERTSRLKAAAEKPAPKKRTRAVAADKAAPADDAAPDETTDAPKPKRTRKPAAAKSADESEE